MRLILLTFIAPVPISRGSETSYAHSADRISTFAISRVVRSVELSRLSKTVVTLPDRQEATFTRLIERKVRMSPISITVLAIGMSVDALLASIGRGAGLRRPRLSEAMRTGFAFGLVETITPLVGWLAGVAASRYVAAVDHWIAFGLLACVGGRMILHAFQRSPEKPGLERNGSLPVLLATALGTSIDAMAVGVSLAFLDVNIIVVSLSIGAATFVMSTGGILAGRLIGQRLGRWAEIIGGVALFGLGLSILLDHLTS